MSKRLHRVTPVFYSYNYKTEDYWDLIILCELCDLLDRVSIFYILKDCNFTYSDSLKVDNLCTYLWQLSVYQGILLFAIIYSPTILGNYNNHNERNT